MAPKSGPRKFDSITSRLNKAGNGDQIAKEDVIQLLEELNTISASESNLKLFLWILLALLILLMGATAGLVYSVVKLNESTNVSTDNLVVDKGNSTQGIRAGGSRFNFTAIDPLNGVKTPDATKAYLESRYTGPPVNGTVDMNYIVVVPSANALVPATYYVYMFSLMNNDQVTAMCKQVYQEGQPRVVMNFTGASTGLPFAAPTTNRDGSAIPSYVLSYHVTTQAGCQQRIAYPDNTDFWVTFTLSGAPGVRVSMMCKGDSCDLLDMKDQAGAEALVAALNAAFSPSESQPFGVGQGRRLLDYDAIPANKYPDFLALFD